MGVALKPNHKSAYGDSDVSRSGEAGMATNSGRPTSSSSGSERSAGSGPPLARAGLEVIGLGSGGWSRAGTLTPDELRNNFRGWPQSVQKANHRDSDHRPNASVPYSPRLSDPSHELNAVGGTSVHYWAQSWRLNPWTSRS